MSNKKSTLFRSSGFTLIEILIVIGLIAILAGVALVAINPARQFAQARNAQRVSNVHAILSAIGARYADTQGVFSDNFGCAPIPADDYRAIGNSGVQEYDLRTCLVPTYLPELPVDPVTGTNTCTTAECLNEVYSSGYQIRQTSESGRVSICSKGYGESSLGLSGEEYCTEQ